MTDLIELRRIAEAQQAAYSKMLEYDEGVGGLGVRHPEMFQDMLTWVGLSENEHADTVLTLIDRLERAEKTIAEFRALEPTWPRGMYGAPDDMYAGRSLRRILAGYEQTTNRENRSDR